MTSLPDDNPYATLSDDGARATGPIAEVEREPPRFRPLAVVVGLAVDIGGTQVISTIYMLAVAVHLGFTPDIVDRLLGTLSRFPHIAVLFVLGAALSVVGGFVNGVIAKQREYLHALVQVAFSLAFAALLRVAGPTGPRLDMPEWLRMVSFVAVVPMVLIGARLAILRRERRERGG